MTDLETARSAAKKSANEAFGALANTEPERSRQADGLEELPDEFWIAEKNWLEDELGREPTDEEEREYRETWKEAIQELKEGDDEDFRQRANEAFNRIADETPEPDEKGQTPRYSPDDR
jgi:hypothetical protein